MKDQHDNHEPKKDLETRVPLEDADLKKIRGGAIGPLPLPLPLPSAHVCRHDPNADPLG